MAFHLSSSPLLESRRVFTERGPSLLNWLVSLPPLVVGLASSGFSLFLGVVLAIGWLILLPLAGYFPRSSVALLPAIFTAVVFISTLLLIPFHSAAFWVYSWTSLAMMLMTIPKTRRDHWEDHPATLDQGTRQPVAIRR
jgi:hypothetical protein